MLETQKVHGARHRTELSLTLETTEWALPCIPREVQDKSQLSVNKIIGAMGIYSMRAYGQQGKNVELIIQWQLY